MNIKQGCKQTEFGEIPTEWDVRLLGQVSNMIVPMRDKPKKFNGKIPWIRIEDLDGKYIYKSKSNRRVSEATIGLMNLKPYPIGTVLCSCSGNMGICAIVKSTLVSNQTFIGIVPHDELYTEYAYYLLSSLKSKLQRIGSGTTIPYISKDKFKKLKIPVPPLVEQRGITQVLSTLDECIRYTDLVIEKTDELKQGLMQQLLTKDMENTPKTWKYQKLSDLVSYKNGIYKPAEFYGKGFPSIRMYNIVDGKIVTDGAPLLNVDETELNEFGLLAGDIIVNRVNSLDLVGKCGIVAKDLGPATFESKNIRLRVTNRNVLPKFLNFVLNTERKQHEIRRYAKAAVSQATITQKDLSKLMIPLPPIKEQKRIVGILTIVQEKIGNEQTIREKMTSLREGLMQVLLSGKVRVGLGEDGLYRIRDS